MSSPPSKSVRRAIPRFMTWCQDPGSSHLGNLPTSPRPLRPGVVTVPVQFVASLCYQEPTRPPPVPDLGNGLHRHRTYLQAMNRRGIVTRYATSADREAWLRLRVALWPGDGGEHAREIERHFALVEPRWPQEALLAEVDGVVVGLAEVSVRPYAEGCRTRDVGYLEGWYVEPEQRGAGVGRALVRAAERWAREQGCAELASDAHPRDERSRSAHAACGFEEVGLVRCFRKPL